MNEKTIFRSSSTTASSPSIWGILYAWLSSAIYPSILLKIPKNTLILHYHDGRTKHLSITISREDLQEAFKHIRILSPIHIAESY